MNSYGYLGSRVKVERYSLPKALILPISTTKKQGLLRPSVSTKIEKRRFFFSGLTDPAFPLVWTQDTPYRVTLEGL